MPRPNKNEIFALHEFILALRELIVVLHEIIFALRWAALYELISTS